MKLNQERALDKKGIPQAKPNRSFLEVVENFTDPKEIFREAISNALDWGATKISIEVSEDTRRADNELVIELHDNGAGLTKERFIAFWNLADSTCQRDPQGNKINGRIGEKGHGTKTYWKCREIELESVSNLGNDQAWHVVALMKEPINALKYESVPEYDYCEDITSQMASFTHIVIRGYHMKSREDFRHEVLSDYIRWFTKFGSVELEVNHSQNQDKTLALKGLGRKQPEIVRFGHQFAQVSDNIKRLRETYQDDWPKHYVKKWVFPEQPIPGYPSSTFDMVFYIEGDSAKLYNPMLRRKGRKPENWHYTVQDRYGLYPAKDWIPLPSSQRINEWICEKSEGTLYHAFVNCQDFHLTSNRASIGNTDRDFMQRVREAVQQLFEEHIKKSEEFRAYEEEIENTKKQGAAETTAEQERSDLDKRHYAAKKKKVAQYRPKERSPIVLFEPREEVEVLALFSLVSATNPGLFPFTVVDYSTRRGIDALCTLEPAGLPLQKGNLRYVEFKRALGRDLGNHTFANLTAIVCWECNLEDGVVVKDISGQERQLVITPQDGSPSKYILPAPRTSSAANIEVYVLREYLTQRLKLQFKPRST